MDRIEIKEILLDEFDMQAAHVEQAAERICEFDSELAEKFAAYVKERKAPELAEGAYTFETLQQDYRLKPVGAFLMLDWLRRDRESAEYALSLL